jgi:hypothetical protein
VVHKFVPPSMAVSSGRMVTSCSAAASYGVPRQSRRSPRSTTECTPFAVRGSWWCQRRLKASTDSPLRANVHHAFGHDGSRVTMPPVAPVHNGIHLVGVPEHMTRAIVRAHSSALSQPPTVEWSNSSRLGLRAREEYASRERLGGADCVGEPTRSAGSQGQPPQSP